MSVNTSWINSNFEGWEQLQKSLCASSAMRRCIVTFSQPWTFFNSVPAACSLSLYFSSSEEARPCPWCTLLAWAWETQMSGEDLSYDAGNCCWLSSLLFQKCGGGTAKCRWSLDFSLTRRRRDEHNGVGLLSGKVSFIPCRPQLGSQEQPGALEQDGPNSSVQGSTVHVCLTFVSPKALPDFSWHRPSSIGSFPQSD